MITMNEATTETLSQDPANDYQQNLRVLLQEPVVSRKHLAILASAVPSYLNKLERDQEKAQEQAQDPGYFGEIKKRYRGQGAEVVLAKALEGSWYGGVHQERTLLKFRLESGHSLTWFASGDWVRWENVENQQGLRAGDMVTLDFTVKAHEEYKGRRGTIVTRAKIL